MRLVPQIEIKFPQSFTSTYPTGSITVKSTIDYQGRIHNGHHLGFDYDNIPYFDHDKQPTDKIPMPGPDIESSNKVFLDSSLPTAERLEASDNVFLQNENEQSEALKVLGNKEEQLEIRLRSVALIEETTEAFLDTALTIIADSFEPSELRFRLILAFFNAKRSNRYFPSRKPLFFNVLRGLIKDPDEKLRLQSINILAAQGDEVTQQFLVEEIKKSESEFISKPDAIFFLRQNTKPQHVKLFRELFEQSKDLEVRKAAIEGLDNDPDSVGLLERIVMDGKENFKLREAGALSLHHLDVEKMNDLAAKIISEPGKESHKMFFSSSAPDPDEVNFKAGLLNILTFTGDINRLKHDEGLKTSLEQVIDPGAGDRSIFRSTLEITADAPLKGPTVIEQMAAKLLKKIEATDEDE